MSNGKNMFLIVEKVCSAAAFRWRRDSPRVADRSRAIGTDMPFRTGPCRANTQFEWMGGAAADPTAGVRTASGSTATHRRCLHY